MSDLNTSQKLLLLLQNPTQPVFYPKGNDDQKYIVDVPEGHTDKELHLLREKNIRSSILVQSDPYAGLGCHLKFKGNCPKSSGKDDPIVMDLGLDHFGNLPELKSDHYELYCACPKPLGKDSSSVKEKRRVFEHRESTNKLVSVKEIELPDMEPVYVVPRGRQWSVFYDQHKEAASTLISYMLRYNGEDLVNFCALIRDKTNEQMFVYALMSAIIRKPELRKAVPDMGNIFEYFPDRFMRARKIKEVENMYKLASSTNDTETLILDQTFSATDKDPENRLAYFREDLGVNSHHWHWHLIYPDDATVKTDRRGELFYYMHHSVLARYDAERISNGLPIVQPLHRLEEPINEAYFGKLTTSNSGQVWGSRPSGLKLQDIELPTRESFTILDLETWRDRIRHAIHSGSATSVDGTPVKLDEHTGIDILGNMVESAAAFSINPRFYGSFHNKFHVALGHIHDPSNAHKENGGPIVDSLTAMRDPIFYRLHRHIDNLFNEFLGNLKPYTAVELGFPNIRIASASVSNSNVITTGWAKSRINLAQGLDLQGKKMIFAEMQHLTHESFDYMITVENKTANIQQVCFRIFIAPKFDETRRKFAFREQKNLMIEMDKFVEEVKPGRFELERSSKASAVTIPTERFFRTYSNTTQKDDAPKVLTDFDKFCGCGWPQHMLVPKGTVEGMKFDLFVIATDWSKEKVPMKTLKSCSRGTSYCGILDEKFPDKRPMGYPFDRPLTTRNTTVEAFMQGLSNISRSEITVQFKDKAILKRV